MPSYEYRCNNCRKEFEVVVTLGEHERHQHPHCPKCKSTKVQQKFSVFQAVTSKKS